MKKLYLKYLKKNLGLINLFGKSFGRFLFLLLNAFLAFKFSVVDFASFAIFWSSLRLFVFYSGNNLYIIYFNRVRKALIENNSWPSEVSTNVILTSLFFSVIFFSVSCLIFQSLLVAAILILTLNLTVITRCLAEFAKADNNLLLSIFIEDVLYYFLFFIFSIVGILFYNSFLSLILALFGATIVSLIVCIILFKRKFDLDIKSNKILLKDFSFSDFRRGINYSFLRGNEVLPNFAVRYIGLIYFGELFVAYAHIMYQFYNVFVLLTMAVISGLQSKITVTNIKTFNKSFIKLMYKKILTTISPFVLGAIITIIIFNKDILQLLFPKYIVYNKLLVLVSLIGLIFMIIQPIVFIFIYNNQLKYIRSLNINQYFVMFVVYLLPLFIPNFNEQLWLILAMTTFILVQGAYAVLNYTKYK